MAALALRRRATVNGYAWFAPKMVWTRHNTWPTKATGTDLKSEGQRVAVESVDIAVETLGVALSLLVRSLALTAPTNVCSQERVFSAPVRQQERPQKNAIIRSNTGSAGECWLKWADR